MSGLRYLAVLALGFVRGWASHYRTKLNIFYVFAVKRRQDLGFLLSEMISSKLKVATGSIAS